MPAAILIYPHGMLRQVEPANGATFTLEELQRLVGGYIEVVPVAPIIDDTGPDAPRVYHAVLVVDEDGLGKRLPVNPKASAVAHQPIVGRALFGRRSLLDPED